MPDALTLGFGPFAGPVKDVLIVFCDQGLNFGPATRKALGSGATLVARAAKAERFAGKSGSTLELAVPEGIEVDRLVVVGLGKIAALAPTDFLKLGGIAMGRLPASAATATVFAELPRGPMTPDQAADLGQGMRLRAYAFDRYKTKRGDDDEKPVSRSITVAVGDVAKARRAALARDAVADGVLIARDLVNEPANVLYPEEFARRAGALKKLGRCDRRAR